MFVNLAKDDMAMAEAAAQGKTSGFEAGRRTTPTRPS